MNRINLQTWLRERTSSARHRQILVLEGDNAFCYQQLTTLIDFFGHTNSLYLGEIAPQSVTDSRPLSQYRHILGREAKLVIINLNDGLRPNAILAAAGCVKNNGLLVLVCEDVKKLPIVANQRNHLKSFGEEPSDSYFAQRLETQLKHDSHVAWLSSDSTRLPIPTSVGQRVPPSPPFMTQEQQQLFHQISAQRSSAIHLINADRGRGKSGLLGLLAGHWLLQGMNIAIVCPHQDSTKSLYSVIKHYYGELTWQDDTEARYKNSRIKWFALDDTNLWTTPHDILIVDEAASIAIASLKALCHIADKTLLSTTSKGYEGTGRTYSTRFLPWIKATFNDVQQHELYQPVRWLDNDPVEAFWHHCCYLDTPPSETLAFSINMASIDKVKTELKPLPAYPAQTIQKIISLLMYAHYQTSADDIMRILDSPNTFCLSAWYLNELVGVAIIEVEGTTALTHVADVIFTGQRRVKGHLSAQSIALVLANPTLATLTYWRVQRIAVEQGCRNKGIGSLILDTLTTEANKEQIDGITTSFGFTESLFAFWTKNQFQSVRFGAYKDKSSGEVSALLVKPLTPMLTRNLTPLKKLTALELNIHPELHNLKLVVGDDTTKVDSQTQHCINQIIQQVACKVRQPLHAKAALSYWVKENNNTTTLTSDESALIEAFITSNPVNDTIARQFTITGRKALSLAIQNIVEKAFRSQ